VMTPPARLSGARHHIVSILVENKAGVLARVASLFARRGYNIYSLAVAPTDDEKLSRRCCCRVEAGTGSLL